MAELYISNACDRGRKFLESNTSNASAHKLRFPLLELSSLQGTISLVIVIFLCALICSLCFDSILRYTLRWTRSFAVESSEDFATVSDNTETKTMFVLEIPTLIYAAPGSKPPDFGTDCPICLGDFAEGEQLRVLPNCNHGFHAHCIDTWLLSRSSCPTCRRGVLDSENGSFQRGNSTASCAVDGQDSSSFYPSASVGAADNSSAIFIYERESNLRYAFALGGYAI